MYVYPRITELPAMLDAVDWQWRPFSDQLRRNFWLGTDHYQNEWLVKMRGSSYAHREHSFAQFAQRLGVSCQSSVYLRIPLGSKPLQSDPNAEEFQLALPLLPKHERGVCSSDCPMPTLDEALKRHHHDQVRALLTPGFDHLLDWARMCMLAELCGANESSDRLFTPEHTLIFIDNEQMFSTRPANIWTSGWLLDSDGKPSPLGVEVAVDLCNRILDIPDEELVSFATVPAEFEVLQPHPVGKILLASKFAAAAFLIDVENI
jgi:hypothetical protein